MIRRGQAARSNAQNSAVSSLNSDARRSPEASDLICNWIREKQISGPDGESIIGDVRSEFAARERDGTFPAYSNNPVPPLKELIQSYKTGRTARRQADSNHWYGQWLCQWTYFAFRDPIVRDKALELALKVQCKRR